jgi:TM2 domain-containing membrane protein YozV
MAENLCPQCGAPLPAGSAQCKYCGETISAPQQSAPQQPQQPVYQQQQPMYQQQPIYQQQQPVYDNGGINTAWPIKSKIAAGILAIFLGGIGVHKFYLGKIGLGVLYLVFCWTGIPAIVGFIEGIIYLCSNDYNFQIKNHVRLQ